ncbi:MAG: TetR/AcrR family transcriptional regulator [bacterium]
MRKPDPPGEQSDTAQTLLSATEACLRKYGYAGLSTRKVAEMAEMPLSQIHYHFGTKKNLVLALLARQNERLLERQTEMYGEQLPLWKRWEIACDFLDVDLESGYVRILLEMTAAGWSDPEIAAEMQKMMGGWFDLLTRVAEEASAILGGLGPFTPAEMANMVGLLFYGVELAMLSGLEEAGQPVRSPLRKIGELIRAAEEQAAEK